MSNQSLLIVIIVELVLWFALVVCLGGCTKIPKRQTSADRRAHERAVWDRHWKRHWASLEAREAFERRTEAMTTPSHQELFLDAVVDADNAGEAGLLLAAVGELIRRRRKRGRG